jgi:hypothetical protein
VQAAAQRFFVDSKAWRMVVLPTPPSTPTTTTVATTNPVGPTAPAEVGVVVMNCVVAPDNKLSDCHLIREIPAGRGLGSEAILVAPNMQMDPKTLPPPLNGRTQLTIRLPLPPPGA